MLCGVVNKWDVVEDMQEYAGYAYVGGYCLTRWWCV